MTLADADRFHLGYVRKLQEDRKAPRTIAKYSRDIDRFLAFARACETIRRETVLQYAAHLKTKYRITTCNSYLISIHTFFRYAEQKDLIVPLYRIQRRNFLEKELNPADYHKMLEALQLAGKTETRLLLRTLGCTGIRVGELSFVTRQAAERGWIEIHLKGKVRRAFIPKELCQELIAFSAGQDDAIFRNKSRSKPVSSSVVWRRLKAAARLAGVDEQLVYPHNLRHMFARTYMETYGNIAELADLLGHSSIETTRIYTRSSSDALLRKVSKLTL